MTPSAWCLGENAKTFKIFFHARARPSRWRRWARRNRQAAGPSPQLSAPLPPSGVYLVEDRRVDGAAAPQPPDVGVYRFFQGRLSTLFVPPLSARLAGHKEKQGLAAFKPPARLCQAWFIHPSLKTTHQGHACSRRTLPHCRRPSARCIHMYTQGGPGISGTYKTTQPAIFK